MTSFHPMVHVCEDLSAMSELARQELLRIVHDRSNPTKPITVALSGGSTPKKLYEDLHEKDMDLFRNSTAVHFLLGDERLFSPTNDQTNFSMAYKALLRDVPAESVMQVDPSAAVSTSTDETGGSAGAWEVAKAYESRLLSSIPDKVVSAGGQSTAIPIIDVVLLGFGSDGHTASIFPDSIAAGDNQNVVSVSFPSPTMSPKVWRITLTKTVIQHARHVIVLAGGKDKNWVVQGLLSAEEPDLVPVARFLRNCTGKVTLILDHASGEGVSL